MSVYEFPTDTPAPVLIDFALAALRALGCEPVDGSWEWESSVKDAT